MYTGKTHSYEILFHSKRKNIRTSTDDTDKEGPHGHVWIQKKATRRTRTNNVKHHFFTFSLILQLSICLSFSVLNEPQEKDLAEFRCTNSQRNEAKIMAMCQACTFPHCAECGKKSTTAVKTPGTWYSSFFIINEYIHYYYKHTYGWTWRDRYRYRTKIGLYSNILESWLVCFCSYIFIRMPEKSQKNINLSLFQVLQQH